MAQAYTAIWPHGPTPATDQENFSSRCYHQTQTIVDYSPVEGILARCRRFDGRLDWNRGLPRSITASTTPHFTHHAVPVNTAARQIGDTASRGPGGAGSAPLCGLAGAFHVLVIRRSRWRHTSRKVSIKLGWTMWLVACSCCVQPRPFSRPLQTRAREALATLEPKPKVAPITLTPL